MKKKTQIGLINIKEKPQSLVNLEKGRYFKSSYEYYKDWMDLYSDTPEREIPVMERVGIYCMVYSMLEDRIETFWWNCSYVYKWDVIPSDDDSKLKRPPERKEWEKRKITKKVRQTGSYLRLLEKNGKIMDFGFSNLPETRARACFCCKHRFLKNRAPA